MIEEALRRRFPAPAWALLFQVRNQTGYAKATLRTADAVAFSLYPSRGLDIEGIEIKRSRTDWKKELGNPDKAAEFIRFTHRWWIAAPTGVVEAGELPSEWGLLTVNKAGALKATVQAPRRDAKPMPHSMVCAIMRNMAQAEEAAITKRIRDERQQAVEEAGKYAANKAARYEEIVEQFKTVTGIDLRVAWDREKMLEAIAEYQRNGNLTDKVDRAVRGLDGLTRTLDDLRSLLSEMSE